MGNSNYLDVQNFQCKYKSLSLAWPACLPSEVMQPVPSFSLWDSLKAGKIRLASVINKHLWYFKGRAGRCMRMRQRQPEQAGQKQKQKDTKPWNEGGKADKATELGCITWCVSSLALSRLLYFCFQLPTWIPEVVKYGISNLTLMGGFPSLSSASTLGSPKWALIRYSFPPLQKRFFSWNKKSFQQYEWFSTQNIKLLNYINHFKSFLGLKRKNFFFNLKVVVFVLCLFWGFFFLNADQLVLCIKQVSSSSSLILKENIRSLVFFLIIFVTQHNSCIITMEHTMLLEFALGWVINHELEVIIVILGEKTDNSTYWKRFNGPDNFTVLWNPFDTSNSGFKLWWVCIIWNWNVNLHIVGRWSTLKLTFCLQKSEKKSHL